jgi:hypothetical protein
VGRICQQTAIDTYSRVGFAELYGRKTALTAAELLNDRLIPFFDEHGLRIDRVPGRVDKLATGDSRLAKGVIPG